MLGGYYGKPLSLYRERNSVKRHIAAMGTIGLAWMAVVSLPATVQAGNGIDAALAAENKSQGTTLSAQPKVDDLAFLRRATVDLIGRIPTASEIETYLSWPKAERRVKLVDTLLKHPRFAGRWTVFFGDMLRLRYNAEGGRALTAFVYQAIEKGMPYDKLARRLIATNGKAGQTPEVGFVLGDNADPMALAGVTSQVFMGVRIACAQCHDHPFDKWKRKDFYGFAAYYGKTRRVQRRFGNRLLATYTTEVEQTSVMWPPEGSTDTSPRKPMKPVFPIALESTDGPRKHLARLEALRAKQTQLAKAASKKKKTSSIDDLLNDAGKKADNRAKGVDASIKKITDDAKKDVKGIASKGGGYRQSELRNQLAEYIANPRNRYFSRAFVNRVWKELVGRGFAEPIDDFSDQNKPTHPQTLDYIADEFVAGGFDLRKLVRQIVLSDVYQRQQYHADNEKQRVALEAAFLATPMRRMISEAFYDSLVVAGHLSSPKHKAGKNLKTVWQLTRVMKRPTGRKKSITPMPLGKTPPKTVAMKSKKKKGPLKGYSVEKAIEIDFNKVLNKGKKPGEMVMAMKVKSKEELEAERMQQEARRRNAEYIDRFMRRVIDDNPQFGSALRMAAPAAPEHFLRVFGQPGRAELGDFRTEQASMRQALILLNGRLTHEAARIGELEPIYQLVVGKKADLNKAIQLAYREILTRNPSSEEIADAKEVITAAGNPLKGVADLRWVLLNGNEFRFLP